MTKQSTTKDNNLRKSLKVDKIVKETLNSYILCNETNYKSQKDTLDFIEKCDSLAIVNLIALCEDKQTNSFIDTLLVHIAKLMENISKGTETVNWLKDKEKNYFSTSKKFESYRKKSHLIDRFCDFLDEFVVLKSQFGDIDISIQQNENNINKMMKYLEQLKRCWEPLVDIIRKYNQTKEKIIEREIEENENLDNPTKKGKKNGETEKLDQLILDIYENNKKKNPENPFGELPKIVEYANAKQSHLYYKTHRVGRKLLIQFDKLTQDDKNSLRVSISTCDNFAKEHWHLMENDLLNEKLKDDEKKKRREEERRKKAEEKRKSKDLKRKSFKNDDENEDEKPNETETKEEEPKQEDKIEEKEGFPFLPLMTLYYVLDPLPTKKEQEKSSENPETQKEELFNIHKRVEHFLHACYHNLDEKQSEKQTKINTRKSLSTSVNKPIATPTKKPKVEENEEKDVKVIENCEDENKKPIEEENKETVKDEFNDEDDDDFELKPIDAAKFLEAIDIEDKIIPSKKRFSKKLNIASILTPAQIETMKNNIKK